MTDDQTGMLLDALVAAFPRTTMTAETAQIYASFLADLDFDRAATAVATHIAEGKWFPTVADLRERAFTSERGPDIDQAWAEVKRKVGSVGIYREPQWSHPAIAAAIGSLTWRDVCLDDNPVALRAHFGKVYASARERIVADQRTEFIKAIVAELPRRAIRGSEIKKLRGGE